MTLNKLNSRAVLILGGAVLLTSCGGGGKLSFETPDKALKSYSKVTKDMSIAERSDFNRDLLLVGIASAKSEAELSMSDWQTADSRSRSVSDVMTEREIRSSYANSLLEDVAPLNGMTVNAVSKRADDIENDVLKILKSQIEDKADYLDKVEEQLKEDIDTHIDNYKSADKAQKSLYKKTRNYNAEVSITSMRDGGDGPIFRTVIEMTNPYKFSLGLTQIEVHVTYDKHMGRFPAPVSFHDLKPGERGEKDANFRTDVRMFIDKNGEPLPEDTQLPLDASAYSLQVFPYNIEVGAVGEEEIVYNNDVTATQKEVLRTHPQNLVLCKALIEELGTYRAFYTEQLGLIKAGDISKVAVDPPRNPQERCI